MMIAQLQKHKEEIIRKYEAGLPVATIAREYGCGYALAREVLVSNGTRIRDKKEARANFVRLNPEALVDYIPTPQAILRQKLMLRKKHLAKKLIESTKDYPSKGIGRTGTETVSTRDLGKR